MLLKNNELEAQDEEELLEKELANYLGVEYLSLFTNGTLPLITAFQALGIREGEVITTPYSFVATSHAIWWNGLKPVFVDIEEETCGIDPNKIEAAITPNTVAIMPVHCYGKPCKTAELGSVCINDFNVCGNIESSTNAAKKACYD